jgi:mRNA-degrading endonuclease RelE of RelBE toxin-antitoxin system
LPTADVKKLKGRDERRLRVGDYRVLFAIEGTSVVVLAVNHRRDVYR